MKLLIFVFAFCGITCCLAASTCSKDELQKCPKGPEKAVLNKEDLEKLCRQVNCYLDLADRCGADYFGPEGAFPVKGHKKMYNALCLKFNPLKGKYLYNAKCIADAMRDTKQVMKDCGVETGTRETFCRTIPAGMKCMRYYITRVCGQDAGDVFQVASPGLDPYDCLQ